MEFSLFYKMRNLKLFKAFKTEFKAVVNLLIVRNGQIKAGKHFIKGNKLLTVFR